MPCTRAFVNKHLFLFVSSVGLYFMILTPSALSACVCECVCVYFVEYRHILLTVLVDIRQCCVLSCASVGLPHFKTFVWLQNVLNREESESELN